MHWRDREPQPGDYGNVAVELVHMDTLIGNGYLGAKTRRLFERITRLAQGGVQFYNLWDKVPESIPLESGLAGIDGQIVVVGGVLTWACVKIRAMNINDRGGIAIIDDAICLGLYGS